MNDAREITRTITVADQPSETDLEALKAGGYKGIINLRNDGEPEQPMGIAAEEERVRSLGMDYLHYGVGGAPFSDDGVASVCDFLDRHASDRVLVHCRKGGRAQALVLLHQAKTQKWTADEAIAQGAAMGLEVDGGLRMLVETYLREHQEGG